MAKTEKIISIRDPTITSNQKEVLIITGRWSFSLGMKFMRAEAIPISPRLYTIATRATTEEKTPNFSGPRTRARITVYTKPTTAANPRPIKLIKVSLIVCERRSFLSFSTCLSYPFVRYQSKRSESVFSKGIWGSQPVSLVIFLWLP